MISRFAHAQLFLARVAWGKGSLPIMAPDPVKEVLEKAKKRKAALEKRWGPYHILIFYIYIVLINHIRSNKVAFEVYIA